MHYTDKKIVKDMMFQVRDFSSGLCVALTMSCKRVLGGSKPCYKAKNVAFAVTSKDI